MSLYDITCMLNTKHIMKYKEDGEEGPGFYCTTCKYRELDSRLCEDMIDSQLERRIIEEEMRGR